jgi:hypothetical protein
MKMSSIPCKSVSKLFLLIFVASAALTLFSACVGTTYRHDNRVDNRVDNRDDRQDVRDNRQDDRWD